MSNNRSGLFIAEYISIAGSVVGAIWAAFSQQAIYVLAPAVSASLLLNLINRRRLEQLIQQSTTTSSQVESQIGQLRSAIDSLSAANAKVEQDVQHLASTELTTSLSSRVEELHQEQNGLRLSLVPLQSRLDDLIQQFKNRPELDQIESLSSVITALKQCIDELPQPQLIQKQSAALQQQVDLALVRLADRTNELSQNSARVEHLEEAIAQMQRQLFQ